MKLLHRVIIYKCINILLLTLVILIVYLNHSLLNQPCVNLLQGEDCMYDKKYALYQPLYFGGIVLSYILAGLLFVPANIFRKWLFYIAPPIIIASYLLVIDISVYSSNIIQPSRAGMAQLGMYFLGAVTVVFVLVHLFLDWRRKSHKEIKK